MSRLEFVGEPTVPLAAEPVGKPASREAAPPHRYGPRSLTGKLVTGVVSLVVVLVVLVCGGTYFALKSFLSDKLDQQLQTTSGQGLYRVFFPTTYDGGRPQEVYAVALDPVTGAVVATPRKDLRDGLSPLNLSAEQRHAVINYNSGSPFTVQTTDGQLLRATMRQIPLDPNDPGQLSTVVIGLSTHDEQDTLHRLLVLEALIGGGAVLLALLATAYGVQFSLRRLRRVTATAQEVAAELSPEGAGLDRRVENDEPETEVGQLATSFNTMLSAVETQFAARVESEQRMRQFLADASHELRTPLTSIRGYAELARMQRAIGNESDDNLGRIESEGTRMSRLVEDLLMLARGDADDSGQAIRRELIEVDDLVDDVVSGSRAAFPERQIDLDVTGRPQVLGDRDQLVRVLRNLVTNAAVHTNPDGTILVRASGGATGVTVEVIDGGPGLPPEDAAQVFERFWRADKARTRARGGSGLGLSIVATIVRAHGGAVRFDSTVEGGSTVTVWLPAAHAAAD